MLRTKNFDVRPLLRQAHHLLRASRFAIAANRVAETIVYGLWIEQRRDEGLAIPHRKFELPMRFDCFVRRILYACQDKIGDGPTLQSGGSLNENFLFRRHPRLQTLCSDATAS